jgi:hypothetical protein
MEITNPACFPKTRLGFCKSGLVFEIQRRKSQMQPCFPKTRLGFCESGRGFQNPAMETTNPALLFKNQARILQIRAWLSKSSDGNDKSSVRRGDASAAPLGGGKQLLTQTGRNTKCTYP